MSSSSSSLIMKPFIRLAMSNEDFELKVQERLSEYKSKELSKIFLEKYLSHDKDLEEDFIDFQKRAIKLNRDAFPETFLLSRTDTFSPQKIQEIIEFLQVFTETKNQDLRFELEKENGIAAQTLQQEFTRSISDRLSRYKNNNIAKLDYLIPRCAAFKAQILCLKKELAKVTNLIKWQNENLHSVSDYIKESEISTRQMETEFIQVCTGGQIYQEKYDSLISDLTPLVVNPAILTHNNLKKIIEKHGNTVEEIRSTITNEITQRSIIYQQTLNKTLSEKCVPPPPPPLPPTSAISIKAYQLKKSNNLLDNHSSPKSQQSSGVISMSEIQAGRLRLKAVDDLDNWKKENQRNIAKGTVETIQMALVAAMDTRKRSFGSESHDDDDAELNDDDEWW